MLRFTNSSASMVYGRLKLQNCVGPQNNALMRARGEVGVRVGAVDDEEVEATAL